MTELLYLETLETNYIGAKVVKKFENEIGKTVLILDKTIFYPQGGGQPYDTGIISNSSSTFYVEEVRFIDGEVHHIGKFENEVIDQDMLVDLKIDENRRYLNSKLHTSGHLIDIALRKLGKSSIKPIKGFHFPEGPYVEYLGDVTESLSIENLQDEITKLVKTGYIVQTKLVSMDVAKKECYFFPSYIPEGKPIRIVSVWNNEYIPCGGIHVSNINELKGLTIKEFKFKKGNTRVSYTIG
ncbi:MAG TPA: alanine--tRNA ligase-related protein [Candidatus Dojkabacteria bacterium]|nr:alanine--tRNA ligase-related protein [Candidatus Dojkabacteria bacterium]